MKGDEHDAKAVEQMGRVAAEERELEAAGDWIRKRGGPGQVAADVLKMTGGDYTYKACLPALDKAGAPKWVYSLINRELWERRKR